MFTVNWRICGPFTGWQQRLMGKDTLYWLRHSMELWVIPATDKLEAVELMRSVVRTSTARLRNCSEYRIVDECQLLGPGRRFLLGAVRAITWGREVTTNHLVTIQFNGLIYSSKVSLVYGGLSQHKGEGLGLNTQDPIIYGCDWVEEDTGSSKHSVQQVHNILGKLGFRPI